jgi:UDP-N-acetylglucosamine--N-acetylmuramyl-(pentapeptide) pyrophosphoryl-undecaprenol N-acetylglucosamine transferase
MTNTKPKSAPLIFLAGGGTGGHLFPGLALAKAILARATSSRIVFIGSYYGLDGQLVPQKGYRLVKLSTGRGSPVSFKQPLNLIRFIRAIWQCYWLFAKEKPDVVVSLGGYAAAVPGMVAAWKNIPLVLLEQNVIPGRVTRTLSGWATEIHLQFDESRQYLKRAKCPMIHSGSPVREDIAKLFDDKNDKTHFLVMGGSQGAEKLNEIVMVIAPELVNSGIPLIHITGENDIEKVKTAYVKLGKMATAVAFENNVEKLYARTRLALMRGGASTAAELALAGIPSIIVPFPSSRDDHQMVNARTMADRGAALICPQDTLSPENLLRLVTTLWNDKNRLAHIGKAIGGFAKPNAADEVAAKVLALIN